MKKEKDKLPTGSNCLNCGYYLDAATAGDGSESRPTPGSYSMCAECYYLMVFSEDLTLRKLTTSEAEELLEDNEKLEQIQKAVAFLKKVKSRRKN